VSDIDPTRSGALTWHDEADVLGVRVRAFFFDPDEVDAQEDFVAHQLPVFRRARPQLEHAQTERGRYAVAELAAQPDAVLRHGNGLICLSYKLGDGRLHDRHDWRRQFRVDAMLQCIAHAMAVAGQCQRPTAAMMRCRNVLYQLAPSPPVLEMLATNIAAARQYWNEPSQVSPAQLASFCEPRLRSLPGLREAAGGNAGAGDLGSDELRSAA
jgi:hypothetical protein